MHFPTPFALLLATCLTACESSTTAATGTEKAAGQENSMGTAATSAAMNESANPGDAPA